MNVGPTATTCDAWDGVVWNQSNLNAWDIYPKQMPDTRRSPIPRQQWLASINGVFSTATVQDARNKAHQAFLDAMLNIKNSIPTLQFSCFAEAWLRTDISSQSYSDTAYQYSSSGKPWPSIPLDVCTGPMDCLDHRMDTIQANKDIARFNCVYKLRLHLVY